MLSDKNKAIVPAIFLIFCSFFFHSSFASAAPATSGQLYKNIEKIPGASETTSDFPTYMKQIINFMFATIGILAMFMLMIGAYQYLMAAGNLAKTDSARNSISSALLGLALGLIAWLILYTINPDLVKLELQGGSTSPPTSGPVPPTQPGPPTTPPSTGPGNNPGVKDVKCDTVRNYDGFMNNNWSNQRNEANVNSAEDLRNVLQGLRADGNGLTKYSDVIYKSCKSNNVPFWYAIATFSYESNMFNDNGCAKYNNPGCVHDPQTDKPRRYATPEEGIRDNIAVMKRNVEKYSTPLETWNAWFYPDRDATNCAKASGYLKTFPWAAKATGLSGI